MGVEAQTADCVGWAQAEGNRCGGGLLIVLAVAGCFGVVVLFVGVVLACSGSIYRQHHRARLTPFRHTTFAVGRG